MAKQVCYKCKKRTAGCHAVCSFWKLQEAINRKIRENIHNQKLFDLMHKYCKK